MARYLLSIVAGVLSGTLIIAVVQYVGTTISPLPTSIDITNPAAIQLGDVPMVNYLWVLASYAVGALAAGAITAAVERDRFPLNSVIVGSVFTGSALINLWSIPHPIWFWLVSLGMLVPLAWFGGSLVARRNARQRVPLQSP